MPEHLCYDNNMNDPSSEIPPSPPRRRGGQPGNTNSLKHGFYTRQFHPREIKDLEAHSFSGLEDEITMQRVIIRRLLDLYPQVATLEDSVNILRVLSLASLSLTRLMRVQHLLSGGKSGTTDMITEQIALALADLQARP